MEAYFHSVVFFMFVYKPTIALLPSAKLHNSSIRKCRASINLVVCYKWVTYPFKSYSTHSASLLCRCYLRGAAGHPGQQVSVARLLQPDRPHPRLVLPELPSSRVPLRSGKDPATAHEEGVLHREVERAHVSFKLCILMYNSVSVTYR